MRRAGGLDELQLLGVGADMPVTLPSVIYQKEGPQGLLTGASVDTILCRIQFVHFRVLGRCSGSYKVSGVRWQESEF